MTVERDLGGQAGVMGVEDIGSRWIGWLSGLPDVGQSRS